MGYRLILRRFEYPQIARAGQMMQVHMWWLNAGVAPVYREYRLVIEMRSAAGSGQAVVPVDVKKWLPGAAVLDEHWYVPDDLKPGEYRARLAMLDPRTGKPAAHAAME